MPDDRQRLLTKFIRALTPVARWCCLKFSFEDATVELLFNMHHDFKRANGYSELELARNAANAGKRDADGLRGNSKARLRGQALSTANCGSSAFTSLAPGGAES